MSPHATMVKIIELKELEKELQNSCNENCCNCREKIHERINNLIQIIGKDFIENPYLLKNYDLLIRVQELNALENLICDLCHNTCGECKEKISERLKELCEVLQRVCEGCPCK
ncbi:MAG: hypothetical protein FK730_13030 [Asgard group archaeon]|nr:hypothetical protein [Asgard group archaeon]